MTAPTINGTRYPQPVDELLPAARKLAEELGEVPSRNQLMRRFRIGAPKAGELRDRLADEQAREARGLAEALRLPGEPGRIRDLTGLSDVEVLRAGFDLVSERGEVPAADELAALFGLEGSRAKLLRELLNLAAMRRAAGLPLDVDEPSDEPPVDPWDYAEPIGPDPAPADDRIEALRGAMAVRGALLTPRTDPADTRPDDVDELEPQPAPEAPAVEPSPEATAVGHPGTPPADEPGRRPVVWPVVLMALGAFVAVWSGWVGLGKLTGFGKVDLLPGIVEPGSWATIDSAITLPIGVEAYAAYALYVWLSGRVPTRARTFAKWSALASLVVGALGQVAYHLLVAYGVTAAPWWITTLVSCLPVAVLGMGAALAHLVREDAR